jgi:hypothetical protein
MRRGVEVLTAYVGSDSAEPANALMNRTLDEGQQAFTDLAAGLLFVSGYLLHEYAVDRGLTSLDALQILALKVAPTGD